ncbi:MAG: geranyl transferase [Gammaproteobacteria bacterium]|nr:geranyl transferase [Gammaproteobacteria bacterium]
MKYVCLDGGKRFRALLVYASGELAGAKMEQLDAPASAVELIHAYSLIHDDLPCMDDDELRRGKPTCHVAYDEATAVLTGDALQALAFSVISEESEQKISASNRIRMISELANASGANGMVGGQILDMQATANCVDFDQLRLTHKLKTGALIKASAVLGGLAGNVRDADFMNGLEDYAKIIGLAFQITDDILDVTRNSATLGKTAGSDNRMGKVTYVSLLGLDESIEQAEQLSRTAIEILRGLGDNTELLEQLAHFVVTRSY